MTQIVYERETIRIELKTRAAEVVEVERGRLFTRIYLSGPELDEIDSSGPEDHCKLAFPGPDGSAWLKADMPLAQQRADVTTRDVTIRRVDGKVMLVDIANHSTGPLMEWAARVRPRGWGSQVSVLGPKSSRLAPSAPRFLLGADLSALPALNRWLEILPDGVSIDVILDTAGHSAVTDYVVHRQIDDLQMIDSRNDGSYIDAMTSIAPDAETYVWLAGEAGSLVAPRRWLRREASPVDRRNIKVQGYWKLGVSGRDHHEPVDPADID